MAAFLLAPAQEKRDSVSVTADTTFIPSDAPIQNIDSSYAKRYDPRKALLYSAVLPGMGQAYNKKYWKLPLVYGGMGLLVYSVTFYQKEWLYARSEFFVTVNTPNNTGGTLSPAGYTQDQLRTIIDQTRRQRDFFFLIGGLVYILQIVDAHVDAHLKEFDLNPQLQVRIEPRIMQSTMMGRSTGVALIFRF